MAQWGSCVTLTTVSSGTANMRQTELEKKKAPATCCACSKDSAASLEAQICNTQEAEAQGGKGASSNNLVRSCPMLKRSY